MTQEYSSEDYLGDHNSKDHLEAILLCALQFAELPITELMPITESQQEQILELRTTITTAFQQIKDDDLNAIKWDELKIFIKSLDF